MHGSSQRQQTRRLRTGPAERRERVAEPAEMTYDRHGDRKKISTTGDTSKHARHPLDGHDHDHHHLKGGLMPGRR